MLNSILRKIADKGTKTLYQAGYLDENLNLTSLGRGRLNSIELEKDKAEMVKMAEEDIKEAKDSDC